MKKRVLIICTIILFQYGIKAQETSTPFIFYPTADNLAGVSLSQQNNRNAGWSLSANNDGVFRLFRKDNPTSIFTIHYLTGNIGIGTANAKSKFVLYDAKSNSTITMNGHCLGFNRNVLDGEIFDKARSGWQFTARDERFALEGYNGASHKLISVLKNGNVGIGSVNPQAKLDVAGTIRAREVKIEVNAGADFVFEPSYELKPLSEIETFVKENKHLPEIPSEKQMIEDGVNVTELQIKLLQKIEELTLYVIEQDRKYNELKEELEILKNK